MALSTLRVSPRNEIFHLVLPGAFNNPRALSAGVLQDIARSIDLQELLALPTWINISKEFLKLSEGAAKILWNLACAAAACTTTNAFAQVSPEFIHPKIMLIFLTLHLSSSTTRPSSPSLAYDVMWPSGAEEKMPALSLPMPVSPPANMPIQSPIRTPSTPLRNSAPQSPPSQSPRSPRSPRSPTAPRSPKSAMRVNRANHQTLHGQHYYCTFLRQKLALLLRLISTDKNARESMPGRIGDTCDDFLITSLDVDCLHLVLHANRGQSEMQLSHAYPNWSDAQPIETAENVGEFLYANAGEFLVWLQGILTADEVGTPFLPQHTISHEEAMAQPELESLFSQQPIMHALRQSSYKLETVNELNHNRHITINASNRTIIHHVATDGPDQSSDLPLLDRLPFIHIHGCSRTFLYLLGPYSYCSITGCSDGEVTIGAVRGTVILANCERVRVTVACQKLVIRNCLDCAIYSATQSSPMIVGDCRGLRFAPHDVVYASLGHHLALAQLPSDWTGLNRWNEPVEADAYLDKPFASPTMQDSNLSGSPTEAVATIIAPQYFSIRSVPIQSEVVRDEVGPIPPEAQYANAIRARTEVLGILEARIREKSIDHVDWVALESFISRNFMDWLVSTGRIQQILDLVQIDSHRHRREHAEGMQGVESPRPSSPSA